MNFQQWRRSVVFCSLFLLCTGLTFLYNLVEVNFYTNSEFALTHGLEHVKENEFVDEEKAVKGYLVKTPGCTIPDMNEMDPLIKEYIFQEPPIICNEGQPPLFEANRTSIYLLPNSLVYYHIHVANELKCCYQYFKREPPEVGQLDKRIAYSNVCINIVNSTDVDPTEEFLRIKCQYNSTQIYKDFFNFVPIKNATIQKDTETVTSINRPDEQKKLSVLIFGIDGMSLLNFHRQMKRTASYLNTLNAIEILGYNKVGDNSFPNIIVLLTGQNETELQESCWPKTDSFFDDCDFIWRHYKQAGYTTAFAEDSAWMGLFFYLKSGFRIQPTDYYFDHFDIAATEEIGNNHRGNVDQCIGSRQVHEIFLNYAEKFARVMYDNSKAFFAYFWSTNLSHDDLNKPKLGDQDFMNLLYNLEEGGVLNNTALIFMSDHGIRWGGIRSTYQGQMEERLPFLYIVLPSWFRKQHPEYYNNLLTNKRRLSTPYDLHETLLHLLYFDNIKDRNRISDKGISLFRSIPENRTCHSAGIESHWCACQRSVKITNVNASDVIKESVNYTINYINSLLIGHDDCYQLSLDKILDARELINDNKMNDYTKSIQDYTVTFNTTPGGAVFEATVRKDSINTRKQYGIIGKISRINLYGEQSKCIRDFHLKLYCYCRSYNGN